MEPTLFDIVVAIVVGFCLISSLLKGMIRETFSLVAYIVGFFTAIRSNDFIATYLREYVGGTTGGKVFGIFLIFIATSLIIKFIGSLIQRFMHSASELTFVDRVLGAILGAAKGILIISIILVPLELFPDINKNITAGSLTAPYLKKVSNYLKENLFGYETIKKKAEELGFKNIDNSIDAFDQLREKGKKVPPVKTNSEVSDIPQEDYSDSSKQALENLLKSIQKQ